MMCGYLRCSDCKHNFVSEKGEICENCSPSTCEQCGIPSEKYFMSTNNTKIPYMPQRVCKECLVGSKKLEFNPTGRYPTETCRECLEEKVLNDDNYCAECYEEISNRVNITSSKYNCADCGALYTPASSDQYLCSECIPNCEGCGKHFNPENRISTLCPTCSFNARRGHGVCGKCGDISQLNSNGHCRDCETKEYIKNSDSQLKNYCTRCHDNQVTNPNRICSKCVGDRNICPECKKINIHGYEYICSDCKESRKI